MPDTPSKTQNPKSKILTPTSLPAWERQRKTLRAAWETILGGPLPKPPPCQIEVLDEETLPRVVRRHIRFQSEAERKVEAYLLLPRERKGKRPGIVVFHSTVPYHIRQPAGLEGPPEVFLGLRLAEQGFVTLCPCNYLFAESHRTYQERAERAAEQHPGWTGMRLMLWDGQRALDTLASLPEVEARRLGAIGHSLGAKETLYLTAFDSRVKAAVFSEGGIGLPLSNWDALWYLGEQIKQPDFQHDHHELLALCAPRPMLVLGGDSADGAVSEPYLAAAKPVYQLYHAAENLALLNHHAGHAFPPAAWDASLDWLLRHLK